MKVRCVKLLNLTICSNVIPVGFVDFEVGSGVPCSTLESELEILIISN